MSKIAERIQETEHNIHNLRKTANKHFLNRDFPRYQVVCDTILDNEKSLARLKKDLQNTRNRAFYGKQYH